MPSKMNNYISDEMGNTKTIFVLGLNIVFSIAIVLLNKWVYVYVGFPNITLTFFHFLVTFGGLQVCQNLQVFKVKTVQIIDVVPLALTFCGFVVFTNLSLENNSVGTYQIAKAMTTPCVIFIQSYWYDKTFSKEVKVTLVSIVLGVFVVFYYDIRFNIMGTIYATVGVAVTSLYQVLVGEKQHELQMDSMQLLYYQAPMSAVMLLVVIPICDPVSRIWSHHWSILDLILVLASAFVAFFVNLSIYWIIGNTSALTYNVVGHCKLCLLLIGGYLLFDDSIHLYQGFGILLVVAGVIAYSYVKMKEQRAYNIAKTLEEGSLLNKS